MPAEHPPTRQRPARAGLLGVPPAPQAPPAPIASLTLEMRAGDDRGSALLSGQALSCLPPVVGGALSWGTRRPRGCPAIAPTGSAVLPNTERLDQIEKASSR